MRKTDRCQTTELRHVRLLNLAKVETEAQWEWIGVRIRMEAKDVEAASGEHSFGEFHCEKEPRRRRKLNGSGDLVCFFSCF